MGESWLGREREVRNDMKVILSMEFQMFSMPLPCHYQSPKELAFGEEWMPLITVQNYWTQLSLSLNPLPRFCTICLSKDVRPNYCSSQARIQAAAAAVVAFYSLSLARLANKVEKSQAA